MNYQEQITKLQGLQKDVNLLTRIAQTTTLDTHAERALFLGLESAIDKTLDAMDKTVRNMYACGAMNGYVLMEWETIIEGLRQQN
tara:strand:- start:1719 stop:1973 length:255 start_codon:yes stop_codon:yes gene_type:complete